MKPSWLVRLCLAGAALAVLAGLLIWRGLPRTGEADPPAAAALSLLAVEDVADAAGGAVTTRRLVRYRCRAGAAPVKDVLLSAEQSLFGHFGGHRLVQDRYVITPCGNVLDVREKKVLLEWRGKFVSLDGPRAILHDRRSEKPDLFAFDLHARKLERLREPGKWALPGIWSPDESRSVAGDLDELPVRDPTACHLKGGGGAVWLCQPGGCRQVLATGLGYELHPLAAGWLRTAPLLWLDDERLLTQTANGHLVILKTDKSVEPLVRIPLTEKPLSPPTLHRDRAGNVVYTCVRPYVIDVGRKTYRPYRWVPLGEQFEREAVRDPKLGNIFRHRGEDIGRCWCREESALVRDGWLAVIYGEPGSNLGYPKGIKIWDRTSQEWATIDCSVNSLVGWVAADGE